MATRPETVQWIRASDGEHVRGDQIAGVTITQGITTADLRLFVSWWTRWRLRRRDAAGIPLDGIWWAVQARLQGDGSVIVAAGRTRSWVQSTERKFMELLESAEPGRWSYRKSTGQFEPRRR